MPARSDNDHDFQSDSLLDFANRADSTQPGLSSGSDSSWTDTGDIGDQLGDEHDPVRLQLPEDLEQELLAGSQNRQSRHPKKVRIQDWSPERYERSQSPPRILDKEDIEIPKVKSRRPSRAERCIGAIMSGRSGSIHGLTGKALMYETDAPCFTTRPPWQAH